jgi:hypothetical protein
MTFALDERPVPLRVQAGGTSMTVTTRLRERLAALEHEQWAHWTRYLLDHLTPENVERWRRQIDTPYEQLSEAEKQSDREWADRVLEIVGISAAPDHSVT